MCSGMKPTWELQKENISEIKDRKIPEDIYKLFKDCQGLKYNVLLAIETPWYLNLQELFFKSDAHCVQIHFLQKKEIFWP